MDSRQQISGERLQAALASYPDTLLIIRALLSVWPEHAGLMEKSFADRDGGLMRNVELWSTRILSVISKSEKSLETFCEDYRYLCGCVLEEEIYFRRNGRYRLSTFAEAVAQVYSDREFMDRYMNFLLLSHVLWENHAHAMHDFEHGYLNQLKSGSRHLEIGPGHGLLLFIASSHPNVAECAGWDVSKTSIDQTRRCLDALGSKSAVSLTLQDMYEAPADDRGYDSIVLAEVLEHLEDPVLALRHVSKLLNPEGKIWIHVPINSPAPDHLYLLRSPQQTIEMIEASGLKVTEQNFHPMTGSTLEKAMKHELTISAVITATRQ
jgi:2-polyprenyl-3-methyl-5-hydroxy-6-metoxy-1,4-benzoquinol methylase